MAGDPTVVVKGEGGLLARLRALASEASSVLADIDPAGMTGAEAERVLAYVTRVRNIAAGAMPALAARVADTQRWRQAEARSAGAHLGSLTGGSTGAGERLAATGRQLEAAPETKRALGAGQISLDQAEQIAAAVAETASSSRPEIAAGAAEVERQLLEAASTGDAALLRDQAAKAKHAARDQARTRRIQHDTRHLQRRSFDDGSVGGQFKLPAAVGAELWAVFDRLTEHRFAQARRQGLREPRDAYAADALCTAVGVRPSAHPDQSEPAAPASPGETAGAQGDRPPTEPQPAGHLQPVSRAVPSGTVSEPTVNLHKELVVIVDADSLRAGSVGPDGTCEIPGVGPVPVQTARDLLGDAGVSIVVRKGSDIAHVTIGGRRLSRAMRLAMLANHGWRCGDCGTPYRLQGDHDTPYAITCHTRLDELKPRCPVCHSRKTKREAAQTTAAGRTRAAQARRTQRRTAAALIATLSVILLTRGP